MFSSEQLEALRAPLDPKHVSERSQAGRSLSYIESWWAIAEANRIFGFDGWTSETVDLHMVAEQQRRIGQGERASDGWGVSYVAKVRVTVGNIMREGVGSGHGIDRDLGLAHESAVKEAESDARKRALMTFGNPFGLALYDKSHANVKAETVNTGHLQSIRETARKANCPEATICKNMGITKLEDLPVADYQFVIDKLMIAIHEKEQA